MLAHSFKASSSAKPSSNHNNRHSVSLPCRCVVARGLKENVALLPATEDVVQVSIPSLGWSVQNVEGKKASVKIYSYLAGAYGGKLNKASAEKGLELYDEVVADARARPGAHPNIDLLFKVLGEGLEVDLQVERQ